MSLLIDRITGILNNREIKKIEKIADRIEALDHEMQVLTDEQLRGKTELFRARLSEGETLDDILPEAFAVCREGAVRSLGMKPFRVQLLGGIALHQGRIAEMKTGEGKTLAAALPVYLNALEGKGVHVVTVNDYLAKRDAEWMGKLYGFLGLKVGCITNDVEDEARKQQYLADITYGTNSEFGFDYLRDNMALSKEDLTQRELNYAIIDEVDSILIDEARTPLIISGRGVDSGPMCRNADDFVKNLHADSDYKIDEKDNQISLTEQGVAKCEEHFGIENFADADNIELNHFVHQALRANFLMKNNVDYIVEDGEVMIVDEFTGRIMYGRRFSNGLHQAIEAKEHVKVRSEDQTLATITIQNYFRMYGKLAGMTGTAKTEEDEFKDIYNLDVVVIPTNKPVIRTDLEDFVFATKKEKYDAIVEAVSEYHKAGQPVLVGTVSVEVSELLSKMLKKRGISHNVLNAKHHAKEAEIVADAGREGAVTIATNMAGRGTDIILGGNAAFEARRQMKKAGFTREQIEFAEGFEESGDPEMNAARREYSQIIAEVRSERVYEQNRVIALGGLAIIGTERHESRRIDNQLRGRSGRQGDPGETRFYLSLEDDLIKNYGGDKVQHIIGIIDPEHKGPIDSSKLIVAIESAQKAIEYKNFNIRKYVLQYDNVMNKQRETIYGQRRMVLNGGDLSEYILNMAHELAEDIVDATASESRFPEEWDLDKIENDLEQFVPQIKGRMVIPEEEVPSLDPEELESKVLKLMDDIYYEKEAEIGKEQLNKVEQMIILSIVDNLWVEHIDAMEQLEEGIGLRGLGQMDPAMEYSKEGFEMFEELIDEIKRNTVRACYSITASTRV